MEHGGNNFTNCNWCVWTVTKGLLKGLEDMEVGGKMETIKTTTLLRTTRILIRILMTWGDLLSLKPQWKVINWRWCEKLYWVNNNDTKSRKIWRLGENESYKHFGIREMDTIKHEEMKENHVKKNIQWKQENNSKPNYIAEISSKG